MKTIVTVDDTGGVVLPEPVRDELGLREGDALEIETTSAGGITLKPVRAQAKVI